MKGWKKLRYAENQEEIEREGIITNTYYEFVVPGFEKYIYCVEPVDLQAPKDKLRWRVSLWDMDDQIQVRYKNKRTFKNPLLAQIAAIIHLKAKIIKLTSKLENVLE